MAFHRSIQARFLGVLLPTFGVVMAAALALMAEIRVEQAAGQSSTRVGSEAGRVASLVAEMNVVADASTVNSILGLMLANRAVACVDLVGPGLQKGRLAAPRLVGCPSDLASVLIVPVGTTPPTQLRVGLAPDELQEVRRDLWNNGLVVGLISLLAATIAAATAFRVAASRPLGKLLAGIREATTSGRYVLVDHSSTDEIGVVVAAFNAMQERLASQNRQVVSLAMTDTLTLLPNRAHLMEALDRLTRGGVQPGMNAAMLIDLDNFKWVNDSYGHAMGDAVLTEAARRIEAAVRPHDVVARLGGDEFAILCTRLPTPASAEVVARRIVESLCAAIEVDGVVAYVGASVGIAYFDEEGLTSGELLRRADHAMYAAKNAGKGRHAVYDAAEASREGAVQERINLIEQGLSEGRFQLFFQPVVNLRTLQVTGVEALLRLQWPGGDPISIAPLVRAAEETGRMDRLGRWILQEAGAAFSSLLDEVSADGLQLAVNLSAHQVHERLLPQMASLLAEFPRLRGRLVLEITETAAIKRDDVVGPILHRLRDLGVRIALDDFGPGIASLTTIGRLPIDILKVDGSYVEAFSDAPMDAEERVRRQAVVRAAVTLARELGITLIAEAIETDAVRQAMVEIGVVFGQGYVLARPMPTGVTADWIGAFTPAVPQAKLPAAAQSAA